MLCSDEEEAGVVSRLLAGGDLDQVASRLAGALQDARGEPVGTQAVLTCQLALLMGDEFPESLRNQLTALATYRDPILAGLARQIVEAQAAGSAQRRPVAEEAAYALMWLERDHPSLVSKILLLNATASLDGYEVAERLTAMLVDAEEESTSLVHLLRVQLAALNRSWGEVIDHAAVCLQAGGWSGRQVVPVWLDALAEWGDRQAALVALSELPEALRTARSHALHASILWRLGDREQAQALWRRAMSDGWTDFDSTFAQALAFIDLEPAALLRIAACESRAQREARVALAVRPELSSEVIEALLASEDSDVRVSLASNPGVPVEALQRLAQLGVYEAIEVAGNAAVSAELLAELAARPETSIRRAVASSPLCPLAVLEGLALDAEAVVLMAVRDNPSSPEALRVQVALML